MHKTLSLTVAEGIGRLTTVFVLRLIAEGFSLGDIRAVQY